MIQLLAYIALPMMAAACGGSHNEQLNLDIHSKFDYGISAGLGMEVGVARRHSVTLEGRFYYGLRDVFSNHKKDPFSGSSGMSLMFTLGYNYQIR